jgi:hypothetical protein
MSRQAKDALPVGVSFLSHDNDDYFVASWSDMKRNIRQKRTYFSVREYGYERAQELAIEHRRVNEKRFLELEGLQA